MWVIASRDFHPKDHCSFTSQGGPWPPHCVVGTHGVDYHPELELPAGVIEIRKATSIDKEAYSAFQGTYLKSIIKEHGIRTLYVSGLATDYCVKETALDALQEGLRVIVLEDAICAVNLKPSDGDEAIRLMAARGAEFVKTTDLKDPEPDSALLIADVQNDFCDGGALAIKGGTKVIAPLNALMRKWASTELF